jgi:hypothetical protein
LVLSPDARFLDLVVGAGLVVSVFLLFAAVLAWQLGGFLAETLALMRCTERGIGIGLLGGDGHHFVREVWALEGQEAVRKLANVHIQLLLRRR